jgi:hypothetical protein
MHSATISGSGPLDVANAAEERRQETAVEVAYRGADHRRHILLRLSSVGEQNTDLVTGQFPIAVGNPDPRSGIRPLRSLVTGAQIAATCESIAAASSTPVTAKPFFSSTPSTMVPPRRQAMGMPQTLTWETW